MIFERFIYHENINDYIEIHDKIFPKDPYHAPAVFYKCYTDGKYLGFFSGYLHDMATFYIQRIGIPEAYRNNRLSRKLVNEIWNHLKSEGFSALLGTVRADNIPTLIVALKTGWTVHGFRVASDGNKFVEITKDLQC